MLAGLVGYAGDSGPAMLFPAATVLGCLSVCLQGIIIRVMAQWLGHSSYWMGDTYRRTLLASPFRSLVGLVEELLN